MITSTSITVDNVVKYYGAVEVISGLSAHLEAGDFTVVLGPSGCGKSTFLSMLAGLEEVSSGRLLFGEREVQNVAAKDRGCAMVFQNYALYPHMSVAQNIGYSLKLAGMPRHKMEERVAQVAKLAELSHLLDRRPSQLSGGQRQRVAIARAIVREPGVLLFDEPLSNLDAQLRHDMRVELANLHERISSTSVFVTHDQVEAMTLADKILILNKGRIEQFATPDEVYHRPQTTFVAGFIGAPPMNLISANGDGTALRIPGGAEIIGHGRSGDVIVGIRAEKLIPSDKGLKGNVLYREDLGSHRVLLVQLEGGEKVRVSVAHGAEYADTGELYLSFMPGDVHLFDSQTQVRIN